MQRITLRRPCTPAQFEDCAGRLHSELLDRSRPLWRMVVIDGLRRGQIGLYIKAHHAVLDGQAGVLLSNALFDLTSKPRRLPRGTAPHAAAEFARRVESLAADVDGFSGRSSCGVTLDCPSESFPAVLELFAEALLEPAFDAEEIERERRDTLAALARREDHLAVRAFDLFASAHWQHHPYRLPLPGTPETVARFSPEELVAHHDRLVRAHRCRLPWLPNNIRDRWRSASDLQRVS